MFDILQYGFMQRALISGVAVATTCSAIGLFLVLRRQSLFADALSHMAFGGISIGLFTNLYPIWTAFMGSIFAALGVTKLKESTKIPSDSAVAVLLSAGLAVGVLLISLAGCFTLDEEQAKVSGIHVSKLNYLFIVLASITVIASIRLVGVLLISSLIVIPNIAAIIFGKGFKQTALKSISIAILSVLTGIIISYVMNLAPSGTIVLVSIGTFFVTMTVKYIIRMSK